MYVKKELRAEYDKFYYNKDAITDTRQVAKGDKIKVYQAIASGNPASIKSTLIGIRETIATVGHITTHYVYTDAGERFHIRSRHRPCKIVKL